MKKNSTSKDSQIDIFWAAVSYFSRLPVPQSFAPHERVLARAVRFLPLVGLLIGLTGAALLWLAALLWPLSLAVLIAMAGMMWMSGALHEDGWADCCDGFAANGDREKRLAVMRDPRLGSFGVLGLVSMVLAKALALHAIAQQDLLSALSALVGAQVLSRSLPMVVMRALPYVRQAQPTRASTLVRHALRAGDVALVLLCGLAVLLVWAWLAPLAVLKVSALVVVLTAAWIALLRNKLGAYNGDALGGVQQLGELACYLGFLA